MFEQSNKARSPREARRAFREGNPAGAGLSIATVFTAFFLIVAFTG